MKRNRIVVGTQMTARIVIRQRISLFLLAALPAIFYLLIFLTTKDRPVPFKLASVPGEPVIQANERNESLIFMGVATIGFLSAFLALTLIQREKEVTKRLVLCGYSIVEVVVSKMIVLLFTIIVISLYVGGLLLLFFRPDNYLNVMIGFALTGFVYGTYGLLVGSLLNGELEGILMVILLANIDAGWLQNPMFYAEAQNQNIIKFLPAFFPSQVSLVSAFSQREIDQPLLGSLIYGFIFLIVSLIIYKTKMQISK